MPSGYIMNWKIFALFALTAGMHI
ncbi:type-F conjugative transfer system pilin assembly protein TrbC, partial [Escherichia coli]